MESLTQKKEILHAHVQLLEHESHDVKTVIRNLHLIGFGRGSEPCAVDVDKRNGRIIRVRPLHYDWKYDREEIKLPCFEINGKILKWPHFKSLPSYHALVYKKRAYSPNRVKYPLKRIDFDHRKPPDQRNQQNRGVSGYVRISWDEALDIIESEIKRIKNTYGLHSCLVLADGHGQSDPLHTVHGYAHTLFQLLGGCVTAVRNPDSWEGWYYGARHVWGFPGPAGTPPPDYVLEDILKNSELIISNANLDTTPSGFEGQTGTLLMLWLRELGKRIIWITPEANYTICAHMYWVNGGKWIPILPNTDSALYLAIAYTWITEGTYDKEFVATHTHGFDGFKKYILGDEDGVPKTPKWAESITKIPSRIIKALARLWASKRTSYINFFGGGKIRGPYASEPARLEACLLAMQGIGKPGIQFMGGLHITMYFNQDPEVKKFVPRVMHPSALPTASAWGPGEVFVRGGVSEVFVPKTLVADAILNPPIKWYGTTSFTAPTSDQFELYQFPPPGYPEIHMIWNENSCLTACWHPGNKYVEAFRSHKIEFYVAMGPWLENDMLFADLILPNTTVFETDDVAFGYPLVAYYCERAIEPLGESKSNYEVYCLIAKWFGILEKFTGGKSPEEWLKAWFETQYVSKIMSWDEFKKVGYFPNPFPTPKEWETIKSKYNPKPFMTEYYVLPEGNNMGYPDVTPTGKLEFSSVNLAKYANLEINGVMFKDERPPVPHYIPYGVAYQESLIHPMSKKYPLLMQSNHPRWRHHSMLDDVAWLREIPTCKIKGPDGYLYEPLWIHPYDAAKRGIKHGDVVKVHNDRGVVLGAAYVTERISPGVVYMDHGSRTDPITYDEHGKILIDRGGNINLIAPGTCKTYPLMAVTAYLVDVEKVDVFELAKQFPDAFNRMFHPDAGLYYNSWVRG